MRTFLSFIFISVFFLSASSQSFEWIRGRDINYQMNPGMLGYSVCVNPDGSVWHGGMKNFVEFYNEAMGNLFLTHFDADGNQDLDFEITGSATLIDMETGVEGYVYITGQYLNDLHFWDGQVLDFTGPNINGFLARFSPDGEIDWIINLNTILPDAVPEDISIHNGNIYLAHSEWISSHVSEFDQQGYLLRTIIQNEVGIASGVVVDTQGNIYTTGSCANEQSTFGGTAFPAPFPYNMYMTKYNPLGIPQWVKFVEDITCIKPSITLTDDDKIIWSGPLNNEAMFDTIQLMGPSWVDDLFVTAFNSEGHSLWGIEVPEVLTGDAVTGRFKPVHVLSDNSIAVAGLTRGVVDWGNGVVSATEALSTQSMVLNISSEGVPNWVKTGIGDGYNQVLAIDGDLDGNLYITGTSHGTIQFDTCSYTGISFYYPYLAKLNTNLNTGIFVPKHAGNILIYPNPATDELIVETSSYGLSTFIISNLNGQVIKQFSGNSKVTHIDASNVPAGVYLLKLVNETTTSIRKIVINP